MLNEVLFWRFKVKDIILLGVCIFFLFILMDEINVKKKQQESEKKIKEERWQLERSKLVIELEGKIIKFKRAEDLEDYRLGYEIIEDIDKRDLWKDMSVNKQELIAMVDQKHLDKVNEIVEKIKKGEGDIKDIEMFNTCLNNMKRECNDELINLDYSALMSLVDYGKESYHYGEEIPYQKY